MSGYCPDCGNTICLCEELKQETTASIQDFHEKYKELEVRNKLLKELIIEVQDRFETCNYIAGFWFEWEEKADKAVGK